MALNSTKLFFPMEKYRRYTDLEQIRLAEKHKRLFRGRLTYAVIQKTRLQALSEMYKVPADTVEREFNPSWFRKVFLLFPIAITIFCSFALIHLKQRAEVLYLVSFPLILVSAFCIYDGFFNRQTNFHIYVDATGIRMAEDRFYWSEILETAILQIGSGRNSKYYLVLLFNDGSYRKFSLRQFLSLWGFRDQLSTYIEYFRNKRLI